MWKWRNIINRNENKLLDSLIMGNYWQSKEDNWIKYFNNEKLISILIEIVQAKLLAKNYLIF